jgi:hypothetical protein
MRASPTNTCTDMNVCTPSRIVATSTAIGTSTSNPIAAVSRSLPAGFVFRPRNVIPKTLPVEVRLT